MTDTWIEAGVAKVSQSILYDVLGVTHGLREVKAEADTPAHSVELEYDCTPMLIDGEPDPDASGDGMIFRFGDYDIDGEFVGGAYTATSPSQTGIIVITSDDPVTMIWGQLGNTTEEFMFRYNHNNCRIRIIQICE